MKVIAIYKSRVPGWFGADGMTLYPFIFFGDDKAEAMRSRIVHHELVHVRQVRATGWIAFYASYFWQYVKWWLIKGFDGELAYRTISWEKEAYATDATIELTNDEKKEFQLEA